MQISNEHKTRIKNFLIAGEKLQAVRYIQKNIVSDLEEALTLAEELDIEETGSKERSELNAKIDALKQELADKELQFQKASNDLIASKNQIEQTKELLTSINTNLSEGIYRSHAQGGLVYVNEAFVKLFGYDSVEEMLTIPSHELYPDSHSRKGLTESILKDKSRSNNENLFKRKDGSTFWALNSFYLTFDKDGNAIFDGAIRDITEEKEAQKKILESQRLLESINTNLTEGIYRSHIKGGLVYVNQAFANMFGYDTPEDVLAIKSMNLYADPAYRKTRLAHQEETHHEEILFKRKDGSTFWGLSNFLVSKDEEGLDIFDGVIRDITNQKLHKEELNTLNTELLIRNTELAKKEKELEKSLEELSDRNFELDQLVYKTSHDLRSPLRSVLGLVNLYQLENSANPNPYIEKIEDRIQKMDEFIQSMLDYSRTSRMALSYTKVDVLKLINESIEGLEFLEGFKKMNIQINAKKNAHLIVTDILRLKIVIGNILSNAIKYRNPELEKNKLTIDIIRLKTATKIVIEDDGIGISQDYLSKVFDMFYRATEQSDGSGLGMYIVKQSIDRLEGNIKINSELGVGTTITIKLPHRKEEEPEE